MNYKRELLAKYRCLHAIPSEGWGQNEVRFANSVSMLHISRYLTSIEFIDTGYISLEQKQTGMASLPPEHTAMDYAPMSLPDGAILSPSLAKRRAGLIKPIETEAVPELPDIPIIKTETRGRKPK